MRETTGPLLALRRLSFVCAAYDSALAVGMLAAAPWLATLFGGPQPVPLINAQLNGVFTLSLAGGYLWAAGDMGARRGYLWFAGVLAKGMGALLFVWDHFTQGSPTSYLLFAATDGALALLTLVLLLRR